MPLFGPPNVEKMIEKKDTKGLVKLLQTSTDPALRQQAVAALLKVGDRQACDPLYLAKDDPDMNVRALAALALGYLGDPRAVDRLIATMHSGGEANVQLLGRLGTKDALDHLRSMLETPHHSSAATVAAAEILTRFGDLRAVKGIVGELMKVGDAHRPRVVRALTAFGEAAVPPLMDELKRGKAITDTWDSAREWLQEGFFALGVPARNALINSLAQPAQDELFVDYVRLLEKMEGGMNSYWSLVARAIVRKDWAQVAEHGLIAQDVILARLRSGAQDQDELVKALAHALGPDACGELINMLNDEEYQSVHSTLLEQLAMLDEVDADKAISTLVKFLDAPGYDLQENAARALCRFRSQQVEQALESLLDLSRFPRLRKIAAQALQEWGRKPASDRALAVYHLTHREWDAFQRLDSLVKDQALDDLLASLNTSSGEDKTDIIHCLGMVGDERAVEPLITALKDWDENVRERACAALGMLGNVRALPALEQVAKYDSFKADSFRQDTVTNPWKYDHTGGSDDYWSSSDSSSDDVYPVRYAAHAAIAQINKKL